MTGRLVRGASLLLWIGGILSAMTHAQWLNYPSPRLPRLADGTPDLRAPAPRAVDGKPDLSGVWQFALGLGYSGNIVADLTPQEIAPWADALFRKRLANLGIDDSSLVGCLPRGPRYFVGSGAVPHFVKIMQTPDVITILYEELSFRQIFMDGRPLPQDPDPSFMGYSIGRWEGDELVVESVGFDDRTWLDFGGHPHTEALRITERFRRTSVGSMALQVTFSDPGAYARPWTIPVPVMPAPDTDLLEYVCLETSKNGTVVGRTEAERRAKVPSGVLAGYVGTYRLEATPEASRRLAFSELRVSMDGDDLLLDIDGKGRLPLVPMSVTAFSVRLVNIEFVGSKDGSVTHLVNLQNGARFPRQP